VTAPVPDGSAGTEPAEQQTLGPTGHPAVDAALADLDAAEPLEPAAQVAVYEQAHRALSQTLAAIDQS
jgi:hypothetical protein